MVAEYTVKIGNRFYRAGEELPALTPKEEKVVEPVKVEAEEVKTEKVTATKPKRTYTRKKG